MPGRCSTAWPAADPAAGAPHLTPALSPQRAERELSAGAVGRVALSAAGRGRGRGPGANAMGRVRWLERGCGRGGGRPPHPGPLPPTGGEGGVGWRSRAGCPLRRGRGRGRGPVANAMGRVRWLERGCGRGGGRPPHPGPPPQWAERELLAGAVGRVALSAAGRGRGRGPVANAMGRVRWPAGVAEAVPPPTSPRPSPPKRAERELSIRGRRAAIPRPGGWRKGWWWRRGGGGGLPWPSGGCLFRLPGGRESPSGR